MTHDEWLAEEMKARAAQKRSIRLQVWIVGALLFWLLFSIGFFVITFFFPEMKVFLEWVRYSMNLFSAGISVYFSFVTRVKRLIYLNWSAAALYLIIFGLDVGGVI